MGKAHQLAYRRQAILNAITEAGQLSVRELSERFNVSEVTIRADLQALSARDMLLRTRGGGLSIEALPELSFDVRQQQFAEEKSRIGRGAALLVESGCTIALDASTTAAAILPHLSHLTELNIVTNSLKVAMNVLRLPNLQVYVIGGQLRRDSISLVGQSINELAPTINVDIGFFGARGLSVEHGLTDVHLEEVKIKRRMVKNCRRVVGVLHSQKLGQIAAATFAHLEQVDTIITDGAAPKNMVAQIQDNGVEVILV